MSSKHPGNIEQRRLPNADQKNILSLPLYEIRYINSERQSVIEMRRYHLTIHKDFSASGDRFEMDYDPLVAPCRWNLKRTSQPSHARFLPLDGITWKCLSARIRE